MAEIDDRVVAMSWEGDKFQAGADKALSTLGKLKEALGFGGASRGLSDLDNQVGRFSTGHMLGEVEKVSHGFGLMRVAAFTAIAGITSRLVTAGLHFAAAFTIDPIKAGFKSYEEQINAVQTILANTGLKGAAGLSKVNAVLSDLQQYANKTVYSFSEMAKNIGTFTAAGVDLKTSEQSIMGIANLAAMSGSNAQQASSAMYQLSQAIAAGQVHLQDWNSVVNAGIGGKIFQNALVQTAQAMGTLSKSAVTTTGPMHTLSVNGLAFRNSLTPKPGQASWLTSGVLTTALSNFTGNVGKAKLAAESQA
jgi:tape measure domain-containing protein